MKKSNKIVFLSIIVILGLICFNSCRMTYSSEPSWVSQTPRSKSSVIFVVGVSEDSLKGARLDALKQLSGIINTQVSTSISEYSEVSYNEISRELEEKSNSWVDSNTNSIVIGLHEDERWFNRGTNSWWVLVSLSNENLDKSIKASAEELIRKEKVTKENTLIAQNLINTMQEMISEKTLSEQIHSIADVLRTINEMEFSKLIFCETDSGYQYAVSYLNSLIKQKISSIQLQSEQDYITLYPNEVYRVYFSVSSDIGPLGQFLWQIKDDNQEIKQYIVNDSLGSGYFDLTGDKNHIGKGFLSLSLDISDLNIDFEELILPEITIPTDTFIGRFGIETQIDSPQSCQLYVEQSLLEFISENTEYHMEVNSNIYPKLTIILTPKEGSKNGKLVSISTAVTFVWERKDETAMVYKTEYYKGFGENTEKAFEDAFIKNVASIQCDKKLKKFIEEGL